MYTLTHRQFLNWKIAIFLIFLSSGLSIMTWASRVPAIATALDINRAQLGLILLGAGVASIVGISTSPLVLARLGARVGILVSVTTFGIGVILVGTGSNIVPSVALVMIGLTMFGLGNGCVDVMMNVEAAAIEKAEGRTILPLFHAFFSSGTALGAGLGFLAASASVSVFVHTLVVGILIVALGVGCAAVIPASDARGTADERVASASEPPRHRSAWREARTYALGVILLGMAFAEGGATDWLALAVTEDHGGGEVLGAAGLAVFTVAATVTRIFGGRLVDRFGRVALLRVLSVSAAAGLLLFILGDSLPWVFLGAALWGIGASLAFPLGMSAAADDPARAAARVSAAATIGYIAFLFGPPVLGFVSEHVGLLNTLYILVALVIASGLASGAARPLRPDEKDPAP